MHVIVYCLDHSGMADRRAAYYEEHKVYLASAPMKTLISGPLLGSDGEAMIGSFFLYESDDITSVRKFAMGDPFNKAEIWESVTVKRFLKRVDNR